MPRHRSHLRGTSMRNQPPYDDEPASREQLSGAERDAMDARRRSPREILLLVMLLLVLMLIAFATGRGMLVRFSGSNGPNSATPPLATHIPMGQGGAPVIRDQLAAANAVLPAGSPAAVCSPPGGAQRV